MVDWLLLPSVFRGAELDALRDGVEAVASAITERTRALPATRTTEGRDLQVLPGTPPTSVQWEPGRAAIRNLRPVAHLDPRLAVPATDPRITGPAARLLGVPAVGPLTSKISYKRARVGSEFGWHTDAEFLVPLLGSGAAEVVTALVLLDDTHAGNGALELRSAEGATVAVEAEAGGVVLFGSWVEHRSGPNRSARDRRALLHLFQPAGRPELDETAQPARRANPRVDGTSAAAAGVSRHTAAHTPSTGTSPNAPMAGATRASPTGARP